MTDKSEISPEWLERLQAVTNKRSRVVIDHILEHGFVTTEELEKLYGYNHPPRAARDVREQGIPLETFKIKSSEGRTIAAYRFGNLQQTVSAFSLGRRNFPKRFKQILYDEQNGKCAVCSGLFEQRYLQVDHRIPYEVSGDEDILRLDIRDFMLVCGPCNRAKSWSCEHCLNWTTKSLEVCRSCYWSYPNQYTHIALQEVRRLHLIWQGEEIAIYEELGQLAQQMDQVLPEYVKSVIQRALKLNQVND